MVNSTDHASSVVAAGAVASPFWLPSLATVSETAALLAPIVGVIWLLIQIGAFVYKSRKGHNGRHPT